MNAHAPPRRGGERMMPMWTIYDSPSDRPGLFVARLWLVSSRGVMATDDVKTAGTLVEIRAKLPRGLACMQRHQDDDPCIVEVWI